jgi:glycosyltransferase involved in cell wall biosynthesis
LATIVLLTCNQENYVRQALEGALRQTYSPLEILLSDDCSTDGTFEAMASAATTYNGPHRVLLNRNGVRRGIGGHVNRVMELTSGQVVVVAAGDDISHTARVEQVMDHWCRTGGRPGSIVSRVELMSLGGTRVGLSQDHPDHPRWSDPVEYVSRPGVKGCAHAWTRSLFDRFGFLFDDLVYEDIAIPFRALLVGSISYIPKALVSYRMDSGLSRHRRAKRLGAIGLPTNLQRLLRAYEQMSADALRIEERPTALMEALHQRRGSLSARVAFLQGQTSLASFVIASVRTRLPLRTLAGDMVRRTLAAGRRDPGTTRGEHL